MENLHNYTLKGYFEQLRSEISPNKNSEQGTILIKVNRSLELLIPKSEGEVKAKLLELKKEVENYLFTNDKSTSDTLRPMRKAGSKSGSNKAASK